MTDEFKGAGYEKELDLDRLKFKYHKTRMLMLDNTWRTLREISKRITCPEASVSAHLRKLRWKKSGAHIVERKRRGPAVNGLWEYRICPPNEKPLFDGAGKQREEHYND